MGRQSVNTLHQAVLREMAVYKLAKIPWTKTLKSRNHKAKVACGKKCNCVAVVKKAATL